MKRFSVVLLLAFMAGCHEEPRPAPEGLYLMCREVQGFSGETLELKNGRFRYWFYSDVVTGNEPAYPLTGSYSLSGSTLQLNHPGISDPKRTLAVVNGVPVLWRADGLDLWTKEERLHPYGVLLRVEGQTGDPLEAARPSLTSLKSAKLQDRDRSEYENRYKEQPEEVRTLLRARSHRPDPHLDAYRKEIARARIRPDPKLLRQLVALMGHGSPTAIDANSILEDLFQSGWLIKEQPPFLENPVARKEVFLDLIAALDRAPDRWALENALLVFLRASGIQKIDLLVPETGHRIKLEARPSGSTGGSEGTSVDDIYWVKSMSKVVPACQIWMRAQLAK